MTFVSSDDDKWLLPWHRRGFRSAEARIYRFHLLEYFRLLKRKAHGNGFGTVSEKLNRKRHARAKLRQRKQKLLSKHPVRWPMRVAAAKRVTREPILDSFFPERKDTWRPIYERTERVQEIELNQFSFVDDPVSTIQNLKMVAQLESELTEGRLHFADRECQDIGPYLVLQEMVKGMLPIFTGGRISVPVQAVLDMVGLHKALNMHFPNEIKRAAVWPLPFRTRNPQGDDPKRLLRAQTSEHVATEVIERINEWLSETLNAELNEAGESLVLSMTGEALDNAERHGAPESKDGCWSIAGFMARRRDGNRQPYYRCHLAMLSTGATIAESLATSGTQTRAQMAEYVNRHRSVFSKQYSQESLETVFALQDGVSRFENRGGTGLMDILQFFCDLSGTEDPQRTRPILSIVSGSTCVQVRHPYIMSSVTEGQTLSSGTSRQPRQLWFNPANSPLAPPDQAHVVGLPARLSGTLISLVWTIDQDFMSRMSNAQDQSE